MSPCRNLDFIWLLEMSIAFYCINLKERRDRRRKAAHLFKRLGIPVHWWTVDRHPEGGRYGCFESHVQIWSRSKAQMTVVFEDDVEFYSSKEKFWQLLHEGVGLSDRYDTVHLGQIPVSRGRCVSKHYTEGTFVTLSCYLARTEKLRSLIPQVLPYYGMHIDTVLSLCSRQVGLNTWGLLFDQNFSDSNNPWTDNLPLISLMNVDDKFRNMLHDNREVFLRAPSWLWSILFRVMLGVGVIQSGLVNGFYRRTSEFKDRRV